jgi:hypothetical protein
MNHTTNTPPNVRKFSGWIWKMPAAKLKTPGAWQASRELQQADFSNCQPGHNQFSRPEKQEDDR